MSNILNTKQATITNKKLYTGLAPVKVVAINPTTQELRQLLNNDEVKEVSYSQTNRDGNPTTRIDFWLRNEDLNILTKFSVFMSNQEITYKNGKKLLINNKLQTTIAESIDAVKQNEKMKWFSTDNVRYCKEGEDILYNFVSNLVNADLNAEDLDFEFSDINAIINGNVSELVSINDHFKRGIKVLLGVKVVNGKEYQEVYKHKFLREESNGTKIIERFLSQPYTEFKVDYYTINLEEYASGKPSMSKEFKASNLDDVLNDLTEDDLSI
jgi:hypothetical protein